MPSYSGHLPANPLSKRTTGAPPAQPVDPVMSEPRHVPVTIVEKPLPFVPIDIEKLKELLLKYDDKDATVARNQSILAQALRLVRGS